MKKITVLLFCSFVIFSCVPEDEPTLAEAQAALDVYGEFRLCVTDPDFLSASGVTVDTDSTTYYDITCTGVDFNGNTIDGTIYATIDTSSDPELIGFTFNVIVNGNSITGTVVLDLDMTGVGIVETFGMDMACTAEGYVTGTITANGYVFDIGDFTDVDTYFLS